MPKFEHSSIITIKLSSNVLYLSAADIAACLIFWIVYDAFEHWKKLLNLLCSCDEALSTYSDIFDALIGRFQILSDLYRIVRNCWQIPMSVLPQYLLTPLTNLLIYISLYRCLALSSSGNSKGFLCGHCISQQFPNHNSTGDYQASIGIECTQGSFSAERLLSM